jgi:hypothetical protein
MTPAIIRITPRIARGTTAIDGIDATLMPCANSDGFGAVVGLAIELNVRSMPTRVARKQANATARDAIPDRTNHRVEREGVLSEVELLDA